MSAKKILTAQELMKALHDSDDTSTLIDSVETSFLEFIIDSSIVDELPGIVKGGMAELSTAKEVDDYMKDFPLFGFPISDQGKTASRSSKQKMGRGSTTMGRSCLENFHQFEMHFGHYNWEGETDEIDSEDKQKYDEKQKKTLVKLLITALETSFETNKRGGEKKGYEEHEKSQLFSNLGSLLATFGYKYNIYPSAPMPDFDITNQKTNITIPGESKEVTKLPQRLGGVTGELSKDLCIYGFGINILEKNYNINQACKATETGNENENQTFTPDKIRLGMVLNVEKRGKDKTTEGDEQDADIVSNMVADLPSLGINDDTGEIMAQTPVQTTMLESVENIRRVGAIVDQNDPLHLWHAVMQECGVCVSAKKKRGIVMSSRMMWFMKLEVSPDNDNDGDREKCTVHISDGMLVGGNGFLRKFLRFLDDSTGKKNNSSMVDDIKNKWIEQYPGIAKKDKKDSQNDKNDESKKKGNCDKDGNGDPGSKGNDDSSEGNNKNGDVDEGDGEDKDQKRSCSSGRNESRTNKRYRESESESANGTDRSIMQHSALVNHLSNSEISVKSHTIVSSPSTTPLQSSRAVGYEVSTPTGKECILDTDVSMVFPGSGSGLAAVKTIKMDSDSASKVFMTDAEQMAWQRAFTGLKRTHFRENQYIRKDEHGVGEPYICHLHDLPNAIEIGHGRCGFVKQIDWYGTNVAMKEFVLDRSEDDYRDPYEVYEHEVKVFYRLKSLWGTHVPRLIFNNPWRWRPSLGMELGEQMEADTDDWEDQDKLLLKETIDAIKKLGYVQKDMKGSNFVRLRGCIAMIDFEEVVEVVLK